MEWNVRRIDYAINLPSSFVNEYIRLFHFGFLPRACKSSSDYETSFYLTSKEYNVNFYNKLKQLREKGKGSDSEIRQELGYLPDGILRLEIQCKSKYIYRFIEKGKSDPTKLIFLWDKLMEEKILKKIVKKVVGREDFYFIAESQRKLSEHHGYSFCTQCEHLMNFFVQNPNRSLEELKQNFDKKRKLFRLLDKLRKDGINPIPLDVLGDMGAYGKDFVLQNPYQLIQLD